MAFVDILLNGRGNKNAVIKKENPFSILKNIDFK